jgi:hypothetical protein
MTTMTIGDGDTMMKPSTMRVDMTGAIIVKEKQHRADRPAAGGTKHDSNGSRSRGHGTAATNIVLPAHLSMISRQKRSNRLFPKSLSEQNRCR